jgi:hypothetical protein
MKVETSSDGMLRGPTIGFPCLIFCDSCIMEGNY